MYAIGVFTAFTMAGFGMARYHHRLKEAGWRHKRIINAAAGGLSAIVVVIFAVVKFTEGAWLVVVLFPVLWFAFIRLNQQYQMEAEVLEHIGERPRPPEQPNYPRRTVLLMIDSVDLATLAALRYAKGLRPTSLRAVHFVIDSAQVDQLRDEWTRAGRGVVLDFIDCPDRRLANCAAELVSAEAAQPGAHVTVVLPRRGYSPLLGRLLHDRTADKISTAVSRIPHAVATIVPFDVHSRVEELHARQAAEAAKQTTPKPTLIDLATAKDGAAAADSRTATADPPKTPDGASGKVAPAALSDGDKAPGGAASPDGPAGRGLLRGRRPRQPAKEPAEAPRKVKASYNRPTPSPGVNPIGSLHAPGRTTVEGRVRAVEIRPVERSSVLAVEISDSTGDLTALFYGRSHIPGIICGSRVRFRGPVGIRHDHATMINPAYELLPAGEESPPRREDSS
jgi:hypothetical protein